MKGLGVCRRAQSEKGALKVEFSVEGGHWRRCVQVVAELQAAQGVRSQIGQAVLPISESYGSRRATRIMVQAVDGRTG
ncbi:hypothetical protein FNYG_15755 [Fusarium nygamai]|uniref:Uncharacterized protein n=1 Tax=Gibberella nygamai TaxID=42673 RepID=A0A2K0U656_GIBNY|nr:hypothetical protein FNYG_15755 [Fusarium nygamai]